METEAGKLSEKLGCKEIQCHNCPHYDMKTLSCPIDKLKTT